LKSDFVGRIVKIIGDVALVGVDEEGLRRIGKRGHYVKIVTKSGEEVIGIVSNLNLIDELYRQSGGRLDLVGGYEAVSIVRNEVIVSLLGTLKNGRVERRIASTPTPNDKVYEVDDEELSKIFGLGDIEIGGLATRPEVRVSIKLNELATKHMAILAMTGSGKSNTLAVLLINMLKAFSYPRIILIDTHSEYVPLKSVSEIKDKVKVFAPKGRVREALIESGIKVEDLEVPYWLLNIEEWYSVVSLDARATRQRRIFRTALREVKNEVYDGASLNDPVYFELDRLIQILEGYHRDGEEVLMKLEDAMENEEYDFIFWPEKSLKLKDSHSDLFEFVSRPILNPGLNIISLGGLSSDIQNAVVSMLMRFLFRINVEAKLKRTPLPIIVAIEEAHVYAPETYTPSKDIIEKMAKEGRKFGIGLIIVSQRPRELSQTLLAQCGTLFALRTVNPSDQLHIQRSLEDVTQTVLNSLPSLGTGEAVISGPAVPIPCIVKIDAFEDASQRLFGSRIQLGGKDIDFANLWEKSVDSATLKEILKDLYTIRGRWDKREHRKESKSSKQRRLDELL